MRNALGLALVLVLGCNAARPAGTSLAAGVVFSQNAAVVPYKDLCPVENGGRRCDVKVVTDGAGIPIHSLAQPVGGLAPADLQAAYGLPTSAGPGAGKIVAIFGGNSDYPTAESDLAVYRAQYGLPPCTTANGCFSKIDQDGGTSYPPAGSDEGEQALDIEMVSAACPACKIILIEGPDAAVMLQTLLAKGAVAFSFSIDWSSGPDANAAWCQSSGFNAPGGMLITSALGDSGYPGTVDWSPTVCQGTLAVGGTSLKKAAQGRGWTETAWSGTGSGCTSVMKKPAWQTDPGCATRMSGDVSAVADPGTGVSFYGTTGPNGWGVVGGTSVAAPFTAGALTAVGIANGKFSPAWIWGNSVNFYDVTSGSNGTCSPDYACSAKAGFDGPTGWGTPNGTLLMTASPPGATGGSCTLPSGSYSQSCTSCVADMRRNGCALTCQSCTKIDGSANLGPTLSLPCNGDVSNDDGSLACSAMPDAGSSAQDGGGVHDGGAASDGGAGSMSPGDAGAGGADAGGGVVMAHGCTYGNRGATEPSALFLTGLGLLLLGWRRRDASR
jgi:hypothetical protein